MKAAIWKDTFREIRGTLNRFLAIFAIVALGVGFFAGLKATTPDMQLTADTYFDDQHFMDVRLLSTMGFTDEDAEALKDLPYLDGVMPTYTVDVLIETDEGNQGVKIHALPPDTSDTNPDFINRPVVLEGRLPEKPGECAIDPTSSAGGVGGGALSGNFGAVGSTVVLAEENLDDTLDLLRSREYTVVGTVQSPAYISFQRGSTDIGSGQLSYYMMVSSDEFDSEYYLEIDATVTGAAELDAFSDAYDDLMDETDGKLEAFGGERAQIRYDEIMSDAQGEIDDAQKELDDGRSEYETEKADAEKELADARAELEDAEAEIADGWAEIEANERDLEDGEAEYQAGLARFRREIRDAEAQIDTAAEELESGRQQYESGRLQYEDGVAQLQTLRDQIAQMQAAGMPEEQIAQVQAQADAADAQLQQTRTQLEAAYQQYQSGVSQLEAARAELASERAAGQAELDRSRAQLDSGRRELEQARRDLEQGEADLAEGRETYETEEADANKQLADAEQELLDGQKELDDAKAELDDVELPEWYVLDRNMNIGFAGFSSDSEKVGNLADIFPVFFFLVAALVCLTTMARMVEEQRTQIGILKALGYGKGAIAGKYLIYAGLATILGCIVGLVAGFWLFPTAIWHAYGIMYTMRPVICAFDWPLAVTGSAAALAATLLAALFSVNSELRAVPAELIRPKAPLPGKRVFLEHIRPLWSRFKFSTKVTWRNLFRYKKRLAMTLIGIGGCTALLLTGFGLEDSISSIVDHQFTRIHAYDAIVTLADPYKTESAEELEDVLSVPFEKYAFVAQETGTARSGSNDDLDVRIYVPEDPEALGEFITFEDRTTREPVLFPDDDKVVITEKMADLLGVEPGDTISVTLGETNTGTAVVGGITENYVYNYVYMTPEIYSSIFGEAPEFKLALGVTGRESVTESDEALFSTELVESDLIDSVEFTSKTKRDFGDVMQSLDSVVLLIIMCANLLAFIVLYNLTNIVITERSREIATIKVLGFYNGEVDAYVFRENLISTAIGALLGLIGGIFLHQYVIAEAEVTIVMFERTIRPLSYVYSFVLTMAFALLVDWIMHFKIKRINMVESLKSTE